MTEVPVQILHNLASKSPLTTRIVMLDGYEPGDPLRRVFTYTIPVRDPMDVLQQASYVFNADLDWLSGDELKLATDYRRAGLRSLSIGDVVIVGESAWTLARFSYERTSVTSDQIVD